MARRRIITDPEIQKVASDVSLELRPGPPVELAAERLLGATDARRRFVYVRGVGFAPVEDPVSLRDVVHGLPQREAGQP